MVLCAYTGATGYAPAFKQAVRGDTRQPGGWRYGGMDHRGKAMAHTSRAAIQAEAAQATQPEAKRAAAQARRATTKPSGQRATTGKANRAAQHPALALTIDEARGLALAAQGLLEPLPSVVSDDVDATPGVTAADVEAMIERLGVVQIDTISVVQRSQYLVLWSRLGAYDPALLDQLLYPQRGVFEYWSHAASIIPMRDYPYYRREMLHWRDRIWAELREWTERNPDVMRQTLDAIRERGPLASADLESPPDARRVTPWDWYGPKESRRALEALWTMGDIMIHSRRAGQKLYDVRERVLAEVAGHAISAMPAIPADDTLPSHQETLRHFTLRTVRALGVVTPGWLWDYFRMGWSYRTTLLDGAENPQRANRRASAQAALDHLAREGHVVPATVAGLAGPVYVARDRLADLDRLRSGATPIRTTLLSPFDSLIWDRARARELFGYEVAFEAYIVPEKRRYGYYSLAILRQGRLVGRLDPKMDRRERRLIVRAVYLEPGVAPDDALLDGLAGALRALARFLGAETIAIERGEPAEMRDGLAARVV